MNVFEYRESLDKPAWMDSLLLDGEKPTLQYNAYTDLLKIRTSKKWMEIPISIDLFIDPDFDIGGFIKKCWNEYWSQSDATSDPA